MLNNYFSAFQTLPGYETYQLIWNILRVLFIIADVLLLVGFIFSFFKGWGYRPELEIKVRAGAPRTLRKAVFEERWRGVLRRASLGSPDSLRLAVIEADSLVNDVLGELGLEGKHMADRLTNLNPDDYKTLDGLWRAHRMRNELVHTPGFSLAPEEATKLLGNYEAFLKEIEAIG